MGRYWTIWGLTSFLTFFVPEVIALATGHKQATLSAFIWRQEKLVAGQSPLHWTFAHYAITAILIVTVLFLIGHFGWGLWR